MGSVDWIPSLIAVGIGLVGGVIAVWRMARSGTVAPAGAVERRDLDAKGEALLRQLRELEHLPSPAGDDAHVSPPGPASQHGSAWRGFLWGTGTMAAAGLLLFLLSRSAHERREGGQLTGNLPGEEPGGAAGSSAADPELAQLEAAVAKSPQDLEARIALAHAHLARQDMMAVWRETQVVLERSPGEPRALSYQALVRLAMGQGELAEQMINQALADRPDFLEGYLHLAIVYVRTGKEKEAEAAIERAARLFPAQEKQVREVWAEIRRTGRDEITPEVRDPHVVVAPPAGVSREAGAPARGGAEGAGVRGSIGLDPALASQLKGGTLFVMVRPEGFGAGPPLAAKRIAVTSFPVSFAIEPGDSMTGEPFPDALLLQARLDSDGNPTTRDRSDPVAELDSVKNGSSGVILTLVRRAP